MQIEREGFGTLITCDKNMPFQQGLEGRRIPVLVLPTNRLRECLGIAPEIAKAIPKIETQRFTSLSFDGRLSVIATDSHSPPKRP